MKKIENIMQYVNQMTKRDNKITDIGNVVTVFEKKRSYQ